MDNPIPTESGESSGVEGEGTAAGNAGGAATAAPLDVTGSLKGATDEDVKRDPKDVRYKERINASHQIYGSIITLVLEYCGMNTLGYCSTILHS